MDYEDDDDYEFEESKQYLSAKKRNAPPGVHIPNKNEAKLLRKLMSDTGLSEKEVREHKKYRKMLSEAQKVPKSKKSKLEKAQEKIMKNVTKELKLAKEHPKVKTEFEKRWKEFSEENKRLLKRWSWGL